MMSKCKSNPILDHIWLLFEDREPCCSVIGMVSHLDLQTCCLSHQLNIIGLHPKGILEAFSRLEEILLLFIDGPTGMPTKHALQFTLH